MGAVAGKRARVGLEVILVARWVRIDAHVAVLGHLAVQIDDAVMIVQQVRHQPVHILGDDRLLRGIGCQVVVNGVTVQHGLNFYADIAVKPVIGILALPLVPLARIPAAFEACHRAVAFDIAASQQAGLAGHFLQDPQAVQDLAAMPADRGIMGGRILIPDTGQIPAGPDAGVDDVAGLIDGVEKFEARRRSGTIDT